MPDSTGSSFDAITPIPPQVTAIGHEIFNPNISPSVQSITVPTTYSLFTSSIAPTEDDGVPGDWFQFVSSSSVSIYQKTTPSIWTLRSTLGAGGGGGGGNVIGPGSSTINAIATYSDGTGTHLGNSSITIAGSGLVAAANQVPLGNDPRMTNTRNPTAHASTHASAGSDPLTLDQSQITGLVTALAGKLTASADLSDLGSASVAFNTIKQNATTGATGVVQLATNGQASSGVVVQGNDSRLSDSRTPTAHAPTHKAGGSDAIKLDELASPTDVTTLNATSAVHGLLPKLSGNTTTFLRGDGTWTGTPAAGNPPWGTITGTLSAQTDLQSALNGKVATTQTVNGHTLAFPVVVTASDVGLGSVPNVDCTNASNISSGTLGSGRMPALTGDVTSTAGSVATTLATVNSNVGTFGSASQVAQVTVNGKGLVTAASNVAITGRLPTGGAKFASLKKNTTTDFDAGWYAAPVFNVQDYGAVPNSSGSASANDTAIASALTALVAVGAGTLYFPQGNWFISSAITKSVSLGLTIMGAGCGSTWIIQTAVNTGVLNLTGTVENTCINLREFSIGCSNGSTPNSSATCISVVNSASNAFPKGGPNLLAHHVAIDPWFNGVTVDAQRSFNKYWSLDGLWGAVIDSCPLRGVGGHGTGVYVGGSQYCIVVKLTNCSWSGMDVYYDIESDSQGIYIDSCDVAGVSSGVYVGSGFTIAQINWQNSEIDVSAVSGTRNTIFEVAGTTNWVGNGITSSLDIYPRSNTICFKGAFTEYIISDITFGWNPAATGHKAFQIETSNASAVIIHGITFSGSGVWASEVTFAAGVTNSRAAGFTRTTAPTSYATDSGTGNIIGEAQGKQVVYTMAGGSATETMDVDITAFGYGRVAASALAHISGVHGSNPIQAAYDETTGSTKTNARFILYMADGSNLPAGLHRFNVMTAP